MTIEQVTSLTELEGDALGEIANIAMGRAATSTAKWLVPAVEILSKEAVAQIVGTLIGLAQGQESEQPGDDPRARR